MMQAGGFWPFQNDQGEWLSCFVNGGVDYVTASGAVLPDGFVTDFASVPGWLSWVPGLNPYAPDTAVPAACHDLDLLLGLEERVAAGFFYAEMVRWGVWRPKRKAYFAGVLLASGGW